MGVTGMTEEQQKERMELFKQFMLERLIIYSHNGATRIKEENDVYKGNPDYKTMLDHICSWAKCIELHPPQEEFNCPHCGGLLDEYEINVLLDDESIKGNCGEKAPKYYGCYEIIIHDRIACRAIFTFYCKTCKKSYIYYGRYIELENGKTYKNLYDVQYCLGDIIKRPQDYENI